MILLFDISIGFLIADYNSNIATVEVDPSICEDAMGYNLLGFSWREFPIRYSISNEIETEISSEIRAAIEIWDALIPDIVFVEAFTNSSIELNFSLQIPDVVESDDGQVLGYFSPGNITDDFISSGDIYFNDEIEFEVLEFSCELFDRNRRFDADIRSIALHEIGHLLGLAHTNDEFATMAEFYIGTFQRTLSQGDIDGFKILYS